MTNQQTLVVGANSGIAKALATQLLNDKTIELTLISRDIAAYADIKCDHVNVIKVPDYQPASIERAVNEINKLSQTPIARVFICLGVLHDQAVQPEKRLEDLNAHSFENIMTANALTPMLWIQQLLPLLKGKTPCRLVVFSARVGSISDNRLGGWYSYRASKAALNMMLKNIAIELSRRAKNIKIIAFHPGTTDTPLSRPFQKNVPPEKLFTRDFVAKQLLSIVDETEVDGVASYLDWEGKVIDW